MGTDVIATQNDKDIARIGVTIQAEAHNLPDCDEVKAFLEHVIKYNAANFAMERHYRNAFHDLTFNNQEFRLNKELETEKNKVAALEKQVKELQALFNPYGSIMMDVIEMEQICLNH